MEYRIQTAPTGEDITRLGRLGIIYRTEKSSSGKEHFVFSDDGQPLNQDQLDILRERRLRLLDPVETEGARK